MKSRERLVFTSQREKVDGPNYADLAICDPWQGCVKKEAAKQGGSHII